MLRNKFSVTKKDELLEFWWSGWRNYRTLMVNNFICVDFQTHISIWFLISMQSCTRSINKNGLGGYKSATVPRDTGSRKVASTKNFSHTYWIWSLKGLGCLNESVKTGKSFARIFFSDNVEWSSKNDICWNVKAM